MIDFKSKVYMYDFAVYFVVWLGLRRKKGKKKENEKKMREKGEKTEEMAKAISEFLKNKHVNYKQNNNNKNVFLKKLK